MKIKNSYITLGPNHLLLWWQITFKIFSFSRQHIRKTPKIFSFFLWFLFESDQKKFILTLMPGWICLPKFAYNAFNWCPWMNTLKLLLFLEISSSIGSQCLTPEIYSSCLVYRSFSTKFWYILFLLKLLSWNDSLFFYPTILIRWISMPWYKTFLCSI